jgi:hypothetical protein
MEELSVGLDLFLRDRVRKAYILLTAYMQPRLPFFGSLPAPPSPPVLIPGKDLMQADDFVNTFFPRLTDEQEVILDTQVRFRSIPTWAT